MESVWHIDEYVKHLEDNEIENFLNVVGAQMVTWADELCPQVTGNLHESLAYSTDSFQSKTLGSDTTGKPLDKPQKGVVQIGSNVIYAARVEFGFSGEDSIGRTYNQPGTPFLRGALSSHKKDIEKMAGMVKRG